MENLKIFESEFGNIRIMRKDDIPWFVAKDIADSLGYQNGSRDVNRHVDEEDRQKMMIFDGRQAKETILINESGVYSLIFSSKLSTARDFKRWVTNEVLPSIRKYGGYIQGQEAMNEAELLKAALEIANRQIEAKEAEIETMRPKAIFADAVMQSEDSLPIGDFAKILKQNGINTGRNRFMEWLRDNGYLMKSEASKNRPTQYSVERGYFEMKETSTAHGDGHITMHTITRITGKGQVYFINKFAGLGKLP